MIEELARSSVVNLLAATKALVLPALFFLCLGLATKGGALLGDIRGTARETALNLQVMLANVLLVVPLIALANQAMSGFFAQPGRQLVDTATWSQLPAWLVILLAVIWGDFVGYWRHRLEHSAVLWPSHAIHHSDTQMTWLALERFHPINRATTFLIDGAAVMALGFPPEAALANHLVRHYYGFFIHADLPWTYGRLGLIFVSPAMHRWHHAADPQAFDTNYATVFSVFDRAFGTFRVPGPCTVPLGVTDRIPQTLLGQLRHPFRRAVYRGLFRRK